MHNKKLTSKKGLSLEIYKIDILMVRLIKRKREREGDKAQISFTSSNKRA